MTSLRRQLTAVGYSFNLDAPALPTFDSVCLRSMMRLLARAPWQDLHQSPRLAPSVSSCQVSPLHVPPLVCKSSSGHRPITTLPICATIIKRLRIRTGCHGLPCDVGNMSAVPHCDRICTLCSAGLGDGLHMLFDCEALHDLRKEHADLFQGVVSVKEFMWQHSISGVAVYVDKCLTQNEAALIA